MESCERRNPSTLLVTGFARAISRDISYSKVNRMGIPEAKILTNQPNSRQIFIYRWSVSDWQYLLLMFLLEVLFIDKHSDHAIWRQPRRSKRVSWEHLHYNFKNYPKIKSRNMNQPNCIFEISESQIKIYLFMKQIALDTGTIKFWHYWLLWLP